MSPFRHHASHVISADALALDADHRALDKALRWLDEIASKRQWESTLRHALTLCLDEALNNILMHAVRRDEHGGGPAIAVEIHCTTYNDRVELKLTDNGPPFDPTHVMPLPPADCIAQAKPGGNGLRLIRHYADALQYTHKAGRNHFSMLKNTQPSS